jgi:sulfoxide reductase heme-binding subunit YedZ
MRKRILNYVVMLVLSLLLYLLMQPDFKYFKQLEAWSMMLGYTAFIFIAITLLIGPLQRWLPGKAGTYLLKARRDVGIWAGLNAIFHVVTVFMIFIEGKEFFIIFDTRYAAESWLGLFFNRGVDGELTIHFGLLGLANYLGATAFVLLLVLWITSSDRAERFLGGAAWKRIHSTNLLVFILVVFHGFIYIFGIKGNSRFYFDLMLWIVGVVMLARLITFTKVVLRRNRK